MGPTCSILLKSEIPLQYNEVDSLISKIHKGEIKRNKKSIDFWIDSGKLLKIGEGESDCMFSITFDNAMKDISEDEILEIEMVTGHQIKSQIIISAGCNKDGDHIILGELALALLDLFDGYIHFGSIIDFENEGKDQIGKLFRIGEDVNYKGVHIADKFLLTAFLKYENFRMIK